MPLRPPPPWRGIENCERERKADALVPDEPAGRNYAGTRGSGGCDRALAHRAPRIRCDYRLLLFRERCAS